jgi:hypothetical protein
MGLFQSKNHDSAAAEVAAGEEAASAVETKPEPDGYEETVSLLASAVDTLAARVGGFKPSEFGHNEFRSTHAIMRAVCKLALDFPNDDRLSAIVTALVPTFARMSPVPEGEPLSKLIRRLALGNAGEVSGTAARLLLRLDQPAKSDLALETETLRDAQRRQELWIRQREAEALQRQIDEHETPRRRLEQVQAEIARLEAVDA